MKRSTRLTSNKKSKCKADLPMITNERPGGLEFGRKLIGLTNKDKIQMS